MSDIPTLANNTVKDLCHFYLHLKNKQHPAIKAHTSKDKPTILIIGAGISGLTAAKVLTSHGLNVILLEARDRVGGRIYSLKLEDGSFIEMGAQFVHGVKNNPLYMISEHFNLEVKPYVRSNWAIFDMKGKEIDKTQLNELVNEYKEQIKALTLTRQSDDKDRFTVADLQYIDTQLLKHKAIMSGDLASLAKMISIKELKKEKLFTYKMGINTKESESNFLVMNGYEKITEGMYSEALKTGLLDCYLSDEVLKIDHTGEEILVHTKSGNIHRADAAICTLPLGVLKNGNVRFEPPLPSSKTKAINALGNAIHNKVILKFEEVFWDDYSHFVVLYDPTLNAWLDIINLQHFTTEKRPILVASIYSSSHHKSLC